MRLPRLHRPFRPRAAPSRQLVFGFLRRRLRRERLFKRWISLTTVLAVALILGSVLWGRTLASIETSAKIATRAAFGLPPVRSQTEQARRDFRRSGIEQTRPRVERFFAESTPEAQALMRHAGMDPEHGLLRWGNVDWTLLLSSKVFAPEDDGRSYSLRPNVHSIWLRNLAMSAGTPAFYLVPDGPGLAEAIRGTEAVALETSRQTTNSWGLRGPEPDPDAPVRGMVLGDSYMQGMFIGDDETPPECLRRRMQRSLDTRVSILNAGIMGYSPEQYYHAYMAFEGRFRPQFVVVSIFANDFGNEVDATGRGVADWEEGRYWLEKIAERCQARNRPCLIVAVPYRKDLIGQRRSGHYPGRLTNILKVPSETFLDPMEDFLTAHLRSRIEGKKKDQPEKGCTLYNEAIDDAHFSPSGAEVWAESVGRRLALLRASQSGGGSKD